MVEVSQKRVSFIDHTAGKYVSNFKGNSFSDGKLRTRQAFRLYLPVIVTREKEDVPTALAHHFRLHIGGGAAL